MTDGPKRFDTLRNISLPPEELQKALAAQHGPGDESVKERPTLEICPLCNAEGILPPVVVTEHMQMVDFVAWLKARDPASYAALVVAFFDERKAAIKLDSEPPESGP